MDNRQKLIMCALKLFSSKGYEAVGVQEIVDEAGVTKPTLYYYFGSKEKLLKTILDEGSIEMIEGLEKVALYETDLSCTLHQITGAYFRYIKEHGVFYHMLMTLRFSPPDSGGFKIVKPYINKLVEVIERVFITAEAECENMKGKHTEYAISYLGMLNAYVEYYIERISTYKDTEWNQLIEEINYQFMHGIYS